MAVQSDQSQLALVEDIVREKLFLHLHREIPYVVTQVHDVHTYVCVCVLFFIISDICMFSQMTSWTAIFNFLLLVVHQSN